MLVMPGTKSVVSHLIEDGWLVTARRVPSPNRSPRPGNGEVSLLVVHNISLPPGCFGGGYVEQLFCNRLNPDEHPYFAEIASLEVSAHLFIERQGQVTQFVPFTERAWHAGHSSFAGRDNCNDYSIGIELEGTDDTAYTEAQYQALAAVTRHLMTVYPGLNRARLVGHCDVAPGRKTDPGASFDWPRYLASVGF